MRKLSEAEINDKVCRFIDHCDRLLTGGQMSLKDFNAAMLDLGRWAHAKRQMLKQSSPGADNDNDRAQP